MNIHIDINLKNSAMCEDPKNIQQMVQHRIDEMIIDDPMLGLFVESYIVEVR